MLMLMLMLRLDQLLSFFPLLAFLSRYSFLVVTRRATSGAVFVPMTMTGLSVCQSVQEGPGSSVDRRCCGTDSLSNGSVWCVVCGVDAPVSLDKCSSHAITLSVGCGGSDPMGILTPPTRG